MYVCVYVWKFAFNASSKMFQIELVMCIFYKCLESIVQVKLLNKLPSASCLKPAAQRDPGSTQLL